MKPFALKTLGIFVVSLVLAGCANISAPNENSSSCPKVDLAQISAAPDSDVYFEQAAKIVQEQSKAEIVLYCTKFSICFS